MGAERIRVIDVDLAERDTSFRLPFRYGNTVLRSAPEIHLRVRVEFPDGMAEGYSAELAAPKWFDKNPALSNDENFEQLRAVSRAAANAVLGMHTATPADIADGLARESKQFSTNGLLAAYGPSLVDRAIVDAICRHRQSPLIGTLHANRLGLDFSRFPGDFSATAEGFLASLRPRETIAVRHTVGFIDPLWSHDVGERPDNFPVALQEIIAADGVRYFKIKLSGDIPADLARLEAVGTLLDAEAGDYVATLDGNEQYVSTDSLLDFLRRAAVAPGLAHLWARVLFIEQPLSRAAAFDRGIAPCSAVKPIIIDESDDAPDAAMRARAAGYAGISVKTCKGFYKSLANVARAIAWPGFLVSAEDLSVQAGVALAQNLALWSCLGFEHAERNGHYYGRGPDALPAAERGALLAAHSDLYAATPHGSRLRIEGGNLALGTVNTAYGYGASFVPDRSDMRALSRTD